MIQNNRTKFLIVPAGCKTVRVHFSSLHVENRIRQQHAVLQTTVHGLCRRYFTSCIFYCVVDGILCVCHAERN